MRLFGSGSCMIARTRSGSGRIPAEFNTNPRKGISDLQNRVFLSFNFNPASFILDQNNFKCSMCSLKLCDFIKISSTYDTKNVLSRHSNNELTALINALPAVRTPNGTLQK